MNKTGKFLAVTTPVALGLVAHTAASAQTGRFHAKVGLTNLIAASGRDSANPTGLNLGLGYDLKGFGAPSHFGTLAFDLEFNHFYRGGGHVDTTTFAVTDRWAFGSESGPARPYFGVGLGLQHSNVKSVGKRFTPTPPSSGLDVQTRALAPGEVASGTNFQPVVRLLVGVDINTRFFTEASYTYGGSAEGTRTDALNLSVGMRF